MRKLLVFFIIFFLLGSNIAWAFDADEIFQQAEIQNHVINTAGNADDHDLSSNPCDHCCHGSAHYLGLLSVCSFTAHSLSSRSIIAASHTFTSWAYQPPLPPPNT